MSLSILPLSYCTNVHPGRTVDEVLQGLRHYAIPARQLVGEKIAAGLWLAAPVIRELNSHPERIEELKKVLAEGDLICYTLNAFPFGDFHSDRVKEQVYLPDWTSVERKDYTLSCARLLGELMPAGTEGSLSTVPLGFKGFKHDDQFLPQCIDRLLELAVELDQWHDATGQVIRLAIEPEPCCVLETTDETLQFFNQLFQQADKHNQLDAAKRHLGICYDVCHQAVEFEDVAASIQKIHEADIRINKVHLTCAIHIDSPATNPQALEQLSKYVEPRYLHQTFALNSHSSQPVSVLDLTPEMCFTPAESFRDAEAWRVHFHVPVHQEELGHLQTTRGELQKAIAAVAALPYAPHLEVETYTWGVLPEGQAFSLSEGVANELQATLKLIKSN